MKTAMIFIDGSNLYHNCKNSGLEPKLIDFKKLCEFICKKLNYKWKLTHYYNSIPDIRDGEEIFYKHIKFINELKSLPNFIVTTRKLQKKSNKEVQEQRKLLIKKSGFCKECSPKVIQQCVECIGDFDKKEKGIDVSIAVDIIDNALRNEYECCILISGDADFIPALELAKRNQKEVVVCSVKLGFASELRNTQRKFYLKNQEVEKYCYKD